MKGLRRSWGPLMLGLVVSLAGCADSDEGGGNNNADAGSDARGDGGGNDVGGNDQGGGNDPDVTPDVTPDTTGPVCGDGQVSGTEACDGSAADDNCAGALTCNNACTACVPPADDCGDGSVTGSEECDPDATPTGCTGDDVCNANDCTCGPTVGEDCGNATVDNGEVCDESADDSGCLEDQFCNGNCTACVNVVAPECGDGSVNGDEECDGSSLLDDGCENPSVCAEDCSECVEESGPRCGDTEINGDEVCDASAVADTGCELPERCNAECDACEIPPQCGDDEVNGTEDCDGDAAGSTCTEDQVCLACACEDVPETCGNDAVDEGEACDASADDDGCEATEECALDCSACNDLPPADCGNTAVDEGETCDQSAADNGCDDGAICNSTCDACQLCGNLIVDGAEECDFDPIFLGDDGTCDIFAEIDDEGTVTDPATEICNPTTCACAPLGLQIDLEESYVVGSPVFFAFTVDLTVEDPAGLETGGFADAAIYFVHFATEELDENLLIDLVSGDNVVFARINPDDDPNNYSLEFQIHLPNAPFAIFEEPIGLVEPNTVIVVLFDQAGLPSNHLFIDYNAAVFDTTTGNMVALGEDEPCDPEKPITECVGGAPLDDVNIECSPETSLCTDFGEGAAFGLLDFNAAVDSEADALEFDFIFANDVDDLLPYWTLFFEVPGPPESPDDTLVFVTFAPYDQETFPVVEGEQTASFDLIDYELFLDGLSTDLGYTVDEILAVDAVVFDVAHTDVGSVILSE